MTYGEQYCENYKRLETIQEIIRRANEALGEKLFIPSDTLNCDNCDRYWTLMPMKRCFKLKVTYPSSAMFEEDVECEVA